MPLPKTWIPALLLLNGPPVTSMATVPPEPEWFANISNPRTRRAYREDIADFTRFLGITRPEEFRTVTRAHAIAWRDDLTKRALTPATIRRKLSALSSLFAYLCEKNAVTHNPVDGVKRPKWNQMEGKTPAIDDQQARALFQRPMQKRSKANATAPSWRRCFITGYAARSSAA